MKLWHLLTIAMGIILLMVLAQYFLGRDFMPAPTENLTPEQLEILGIE